MRRRLGLAIPVGYDGGMQYDVTVKSRGWLTYCLVAASTAVAIWLSWAYALIFGFALGPLVGWGWWCIARDKKWRTYIDGERIIWDPLFFGHQRSLLVSEISRIDAHRDENNSWLILMLKSGKRKRFSFSTENNQRQFITAVVSENPALEVRDPNWFHGFYA